MVPLVAILRLHQWPLSRLGLTLLVLASLAEAQPAEPRSSQVPAPLVILTAELPNAVLRSPYSFPLKAQGGAEPYKWKIEDGKLPPGMDLSTAGTLAGTPAAVGDFRFQVTVSDSAARPQKQVRWIVLRVVAPLSISWKRPPEVTEDAIHGAVEVANATDDDFDLTVIVVAVNEIGKAFALGYQRLTLTKRAGSLTVEFGSTLPRGAYIVHADAVAEIAPKNLIHRSRLQTREPLKIP